MATPVQAAPIADEHTDIVTPSAWAVLLWNDPVNLMSYVVRTLVRVLSVSEDEAERLMLLAHTHGKTAVFSGGREECEVIATRLMSASLWATVRHG
ncbi:ATP-dependent Clp protease adaptor ClpS [Streptomyces sp. NPDC001070]